MSPDPKFVESFSRNRLRSADKRVVVLAASRWNERAERRSAGRACELDHCRYTSAPLRSLNWKVACQYGFLFAATQGGSMFQPFKFAVVLQLGVAIGFVVRVAFTAFAKPIQSHAATIAFELYSAKVKASWRARQRNACGCPPGQRVPSAEGRTIRRRGRRRSCM